MMEVAELWAAVQRPGLTESCSREIAETTERGAEEARRKRIDWAHPSPDQAAQARPLGESW